jgi:hypothetical protein
VAGLGVGVVGCGVEPHAVNSARTTRHDPRRREREPPIGMTRSSTGQFGWTGPARRDWWAAADRTTAHAGGAAGS